MTKHLPSLEEIVGSNEMSHLYGKADTRCTHHRAHEPRSGFHQADACGGLCSQMSHHRCIDKKHHYRGDLCQHGRNTQLDNKVELLPATQR